MQNFCVSIMERKPLTGILWKEDILWTEYPLKSVLQAKDPLKSIVFTKRRPFAGLLLTEVVFTHFLKASIYINPSTRLPERVGRAFRNIT